MIVTALSTRELSGLMKMAEKNVLARARRESWASRPRPGRGGGNEWLLASMPKETRVAVSLALVDRELRNAPDPAADPITVAVTAPVTTPVKSSYSGHLDLPAKKRRRAEARAQAARAAAQFFAQSGLPRTAAYEIFAARYNRGEADVPAWVYKELEHVCRASLISWGNAHEAEGLRALAGRHGLHRRGTAAMEQPYVAAFALAHIYEFPHGQAAAIHQGLKARFQLQKRAERLPGLRQVQIWYQRWRAEHKELFLALSNPDQWRSQCRIAFGDADFLVSRLNQEWEMDSTPADLILADGKRYTIVACIDLYSRRVKFEVSRTSSGHAVASCLRNAILAWGIPELVRTDNGADYVGQYVQRVLLDLGILQDVCNPFSPQEKPFVERVFRTFLHDLPELLPGFVGHSVAERKALESRKSFAGRMMKQGERVELGLSPEELQAVCDKWADDSYAHREHSGIKDTPYMRAQAFEGEVRRVADERALDMLLLPCPDGDGLRTVTKKGLRLLGDHYVASALALHVGRQVQVRMDNRDYGRVYVYAMDGETFICVARGIRHSGMTGAEVRALARSAQAEQRKHVSSQRAAMAGHARTMDVKGIAYERLLADAERAREIEAAHPMRVQALGNAVDYTTPALAGAGHAARAHDAPIPAPVTESELAAREQMHRAFAAPARTSPSERPEQRYYRALKIEEAMTNFAEHRSVLMPPQEDVDFLVRYRQTAEYRTQAKMCEAFGDAHLVAALNIRAVNAQ